MLMTSHNLAQPSPHPIADHGSSDSPRSDEACSKTRFTFDSQNSKREERSPDCFPVVPDAIELASQLQPAFGRET
jgi:hypothetical protein